MCRKRLDEYRGPMYSSGRSDPDPPSSPHASILLNRFHHHESGTRAGLVVPAASSIMEVRDMGVAPSLV